MFTLLHSRHYIRIQAISFLVAIVLNNLIRLCQCSSALGYFLLFSRGQLSIKVIIRYACTESLRKYIRKITVAISIRNCLINFDFDWKPSITKLTWSNKPWIILKCIKRDLSRSLWSGLVCGYYTIFSVSCKGIQQMMWNFRLTICPWVKRICIFVVWRENGHHTRYGNFFKSYDCIGV